MLVFSFSSESQAHLADHFLTAILESSFEESRNGKIAVYVIMC